MTSKSYLGGCLCGQIRFRATGEPGNPHACSCTYCQQHSGAPTLLWVEFPRSAVEWIGEGGEPARYRSSDYSSRVFCPHCGSTLGAIDDEPTIALTIGNFDEKSSPELKPTSHSFEDCCPRWE
ncbi:MULTISPECIES: GFA family protein [Pectobacterium]|uniref:GFA family protein n=1 Tax=Pectobacterium carotovorum TaxID=554 RepID=A0A419ASA8_PECCA|nr:MULTISPECIES: GFA family protein [Pectobacterium]MBN3143518.1 GFA family protein [Pectobacterium brasiliense]RJL48626.1 GFA family protein [Pectobacterium carotovorum]